MTLWPQVPQSEEALRAIANAGATGLPRRSPCPSRASLPPLVWRLPGPLTLCCPGMPRLVLAFALTDAIEGTAATLPLFRQLLQDEAAGGLLDQLRARGLCDSVQLLPCDQTLNQGIVALVFFPAAGGIDARSGHCGAAAAMAGFPAPAAAALAAALCRLGRGRAGAFVADAAAALTRPHRDTMAAGRDAGNAVVFSLRALGALAGPARRAGHAAAGYRRRSAGQEGGQPGIHTAARRWTRARHPDPARPCHRSGHWGESPRCRACCRAAQIRFSLLPVSRHAGSGCVTGRRRAGEPCC